MSAAAFDPLLILGTLDRHAVKFVIIGGIAGRLWGSTTVTNDLHICYARDPANLRSLAAALVELEVQLRGATRDLPFRVDARTLKNGDTFTLTTNAGNLDLLGTPAGSQGYSSLAPTATPMDVGGITVLVTDLNDLIAMKRAAGRPKDLIEIEVLSAVREERERS